MSAKGISRWQHLIFWRHLPEILLMAGVALSPWIYWLPAPIPYEVPKVIAILAWIFCLVASWGVLEYFSAKPLPKINGAILFLLMLFLAVAAMSSLQGVQFQRSLLGNPYRIDGLITLASLMAFSLVSEFLLHGQWRDRFVLLLCSSNALLSLWAVFSYGLLHLGYAPHLAHWSGAVAVSFGLPNYLGGYLLVSAPWWYYVSSQVEKKLILERFLFVSAVLVHLGGIAVSYSWGAVGGVGVLVLLMFCVWLFERRRISTQLFQALTLGITLLAITGFLSIGWVKDKDVFVAESRHRIFSHLGTSLWERPWLGWGWATVDYAFAHAAARDGFLFEITVDKAHSEWLEVLVTTGFVGASVYAALLVALGRSLTQQVARRGKWPLTLWLIFMIYLYHSQTNVISISEQLMFWLVVGQVVVSGDSV